MSYKEVNFDGLVGPTHNYAGLSYGNVASASNQGDVSNPREGALQGLEKMRHMMSLGMAQGLLPPHDRPHLATLKSLGFSGSDRDMLAAAWSSSPELLTNMMSGSAMWTANAATITPAPDTMDGRTHFTAASLAAMFHRSIEATLSARILGAIFPEGEHFAHHIPLTGGSHLGDEGAANHNRFCADYGEAGVSLFVYGRHAFDTSQDLTYPGRQTLEASEAIARLHGVEKGRALFVRQNPAAINAGAFHNDVVAVSNKNAFFYHQHAFEDAPALQAELQAAMGDTKMNFIEVPEAKVPLKDAVKSYLFNSQLISTPDSHGMTLILPIEAKEMQSTSVYVEELIASSNVISNADYMDVRQSMRNGGGPACLRLRVALSDAQQQSLGARVILDEALLAELEAWIVKYYRDRLTPQDLGDPELMEDSLAALDRLTQILEIGSIYDFQR